MTKHNRNYLWFVRGVGSKPISSLSNSHLLKIQSNLSRAKKRCIVGSDNHIDLCDKHRIISLEIRYRKENNIYVKRKEYIHDNSNNYDKYFK